MRKNVLRHYAIDIGQFVLVLACGHERSIQTFLRKIPATSVCFKCARQQLGKMKRVIERLSHETNDSQAWLIRKRGYYYRPNRAGYTSSIAEAGRYTEEEAKAEAAIEPGTMTAISLAQARSEYQNTGAGYMGDINGPGLDPDVP